MKTYLFPIASLGLIFLSSCQEDITLDLPAYEPKLAVYCILQADSTPVLYLNKSKSHFDYGDTTNSLGFVKDAQVVITDAATGQQDTLRLSSGYIRDASGYGSSVFAFFYTGQHTIQAGRQYRLSVKENGKEVTAETTVPLPVSIDKVDRTEDTTQVYSGNIFFNVFFRDQPGTENGYGLRVIGPDNMVKENEFFINDDGKDGQQMQVQYADFLYNGGSPADTGSALIYVNNVTRETADYLESVMQQQYSSTDPFSEPTILKHNVKGGLGIFGSSAYSKPVRVKYR